MGFEVDVPLEHHIQYRDAAGRFAKLAERDAERITNAMLDRAVELAQENAMEFSKTGGIMRSIKKVPRGKRGSIVADHPGAHSVEKGAVPHTIPDAFNKDKPVMHPGNEAQPFLEPAVHQLASEADSIARRHSTAASGTGGTAAGPDVDLQFDAMGGSIDFD